jgi:hypothetical protein
LAVKTGAVTRPVLSVTSVADLNPGMKVPDGPEDGALKVTWAPGTTLPQPSVTTAVSGWANATPTGEDCGVPLTGVMKAGAPKALTFWVRTDEVLPR